MSTSQAPATGAAGTPFSYNGPERRRFSTPAGPGTRLPVEPVFLVMPLSQEDAPWRGEPSQVLDEVQEAVCAAMSGEAPLFDLIKRRVLQQCARRPEIGAAAAVEVERLLSVDIVQRHFHACHKRRRLQRDLAALATELRLMTAAG